MTNTEVIGIIMELTAEYLRFLMPVIGVLAGINFLMSALWSSVFKSAGEAGRRL